MDTRPKKIVIIEDEQVLADVLVKTFLKEGYETSWAKDGEMGISLLRKINPDLVILDILMPKKDGYEVLEEMEKDPELSKIPVVVVSNSGQPVEIERVLALGAKDYIVKAQINPKELLEKVHKQLGITATTVSTPTPIVPPNKLGKIMVVEDDSFLSSIIVEQLGTAGFNVLFASDGMQALELCKTETPDLILLDIIMPGMSGFEVLKAIKTDPKNKDTIVIMFSNLGQEHEVEEAKKLGADDFMIKATLTPREVIDKVGIMLQKKQAEIK